MASSREYGCGSHLAEEDDTESRPRASGVSVGWRLSVGSGSLTELRALAQIASSRFGYSVILGSLVLV
jgi:hypothetical protein